MAILGFEIDEVEKLVGLVDVQGLDELIIEENGRTLRIRGANYALATPVPPPTPAFPVSSPAPRALSSRRPAETASPPPKADGIALESPMVGVFYRSPKPGAPPFIEVGQFVTIGQTIGMIEAMKTFSNVEAEHSGTVLSIPAKDGELVQMGKPLAILKRD